MSRYDSSPMSVGITPSPTARALPTRVRRSVEVGIAVPERPGAGRRTATARHDFDLRLLQQAFGCARPMPVATTVTRISSDIS